MLKCVMSKSIRYAVAGLFSISASAWAEVSEIIDYTYYELDESGIGLPLKTQLDNATPIERDGRKLHGDTRWKLDWRFSTEALADGGCKITDIDINLDALIYLPELGYRDEALQAEFNRYAEALQRHQIGHYIIAIQAANKIDIRLTYMEPSSDCDSARDQAQAMAVEIEREHREKAIAFDEKTRYGAEQGVSFAASEVAESKEPLAQEPAADE
ncbi:DUF922 domain-containing protein [Gilvimarinus polysaccharolyticus]|uniref:DUF922 domain-containing protein n=1 Tax=Gilvimarinus polysaccharolyticus TaxID=863921 RepID=UPI0006739954|nr:DUF922 domain-containing protein [Gilvimarinus polysaccharolyticus]